MDTPDLASLTAPLPLWSPKAWFYAATRGLLASIGRLSNGVRIGLAHGFDSGVMLDYVYDNRASGDGPIGRAIDRLFLNSPGWQGIRNRGALLQDRICAAIDNAAEQNLTIRVADLACGGGRYLLEAIAASPYRERVSATIRDYRPENVEKATARAAALGLSVSAERADAFADDDLARLGVIDIAIVSGLHEIVQDDAVVENHFRQIARILTPGGVLLLTVQPRHPQAEFIARVLKSHTGRPWAMRFRPVRLTAGWLVAAGFDVEQTDIEPLGIFGVVTATKR